jgi:hypothetical protein
MKRINVALCIVMLGFIITSCKKEVTKSTYPYAVRMTDVPGPYNAVNIDLQGVEITGGGGKTVTLNVQAGIYNLLNFSNGIDTLIASGTLEDASVQQIRLILGPNNSVVVNNVSYPLSTPSADQTGLKLQVNQTLLAGILYSVLLDFDANKSIVELGNGAYKLKPVIRTIEAPISGIIKGKITPVGTLAVVTAISNTNTNISYSSNVAGTGDFKLIGLPAGSYLVTITPALPLSPATKTNVTVTTGITTDIGTISL